MYKRKKENWFLGRSYRHFDRPLKFKHAKRLVTSSKKVKSHAFRPLISYLKVERRFKGYRKNGSAKIQHKERLICKAAHRDAQIYAFYAYNLEKQYGKIREDLGIDGCVLAYRSGKGSNIDMANNAFEKIKSYESCSVLAIDISGFFDNIDHKNLKKQWCRVIGKSELPEDHYSVFKALTRFSRVDQASCLKRLGMKAKDLKGTTKPLCSNQEFQEKICGRSEEFESLIITNSYGKNKDGVLNWKDYGIPQGTPISAVLSNIFMIDFDISLQRFANDIDGAYWRYSDDILFICPKGEEERVESLVVDELLQQGKNLKINPSKIEVARFTKIDKLRFRCEIRSNSGSWLPGGIQYLGFNFDGFQKTIRHPTIARYQRKRKYAVRNSGRTASHFKKNKIRSKKLYYSLTDIGPRSMPSYAKRASKIMNDKAPIKQLSSHKMELKKLILSENKEIQKRKKKRKK